MLPRIEQKFDLTTSNYGVLLQWLKVNDFKMLYPDRIVTSVYFDNNKMQAYYDTVEGNIPRRKIRVRGYGNQDGFRPGACLTYEKKISESHTRKKSMENISYDLYEAMIKDGTIDPLYGICFPKCTISYSREYYAFRDIRVTIDKNITYTDFVESNLISHDNEYVFEIKTTADKNLREIANKFCFPITRFSKYERAINKLEIVQ